MTYESRIGERIRCVRKFLDRLHMQAAHSIYLATKQRCPSQDAFPRCLWHQVERPERPNKVFTGCWIYLAHVRTPDRWSRGNSHESNESHEMPRAVANFCRLAIDGLTPRSQARMLVKDTPISSASAS